MKRVAAVLLGALLCARVCIGNVAMHTGEAALAGTVKINAGNVVADTHEPVHELTEALKRNPKARQFKVSFYILVGSTYVDTSVRYDRLHHTLHLYSEGNTANHIILNYFVFTNVTDNILHKLNYKFVNRHHVVGSSMAWDYFGQLPAYGCKQRKLPFPGKPQWVLDAEVAERRLVSRKRN